MDPRCTETQPCVCVSVSPLPTHTSRVAPVHPDLAVGAEVGRGDLQRDLVIRQRAHLLGQEVGFSHQRVGLHHLLPEPGEALTEELVPAATQARTGRR